MLSPSQLHLFFLASFIIVVIPGPAVLYVAFQSIKQGRKAGIIAVLGLELGTSFHVVLTALGISKLLSVSAVGLPLIKAFGTLYLIYLGIHKLLSFNQSRQLTRKQLESLTKIFWQGVMVEVLNPKTMLFFFAFLPQFVDRTSGSVTLQMLILGFLFVGLATLIDLLYVLLSGWIRNLVKHSHWLIRKHRYVESSLYVGLGVATALSGSKG